MSSIFNHKTNADEINLKELFRTIWYGKFYIMLTTIVFISFGVLYLHFAEVKHSVTMTYKKVDQNNSNDMGALGGLASLSGIELPEEGGANFDSFLHLLTSIEVAEGIVENTELLKKLYVYEYDKENDNFRRPKPGPLGWLMINIKPYLTGRESAEYRPPDALRLSLFLKEAFFIKVDKKTKFLILSAETSTPTIFVDLMEGVINIADDLMKNRFKENATMSVNFYHQKLARSKSREHREALAKLIVKEERTLMLASKGKYFVVEPITRPVISLYQSSPKDILTLVLCAIFGFLSGVCIVLIKHSTRNQT